MAEVKWIKLSTGTFGDKLQAIEARHGPRAALAWIKLLCLAGKSNAAGALYLSPSHPYDEIDLQVPLMSTKKQVSEILQVFEDLDMVHWDDGVMYISNWSKYQNTDRMDDIREYEREKKSRQRAAKKQTVSRKTAENVPDMSRTKAQKTAICPPLEEEERRKKEEYSSSSPSCESDDGDKNGDMSLPDQPIEAIGGELGQGVLRLSQPQFDDLADRLSLDEFEHYCSVVVRCEQNGKHFSKSHYEAILSMVEKDRRKKA